VFGSLGWGEIGMLLVVALIVFGPDKLPSVARDAARMLRELRKMAQGARTQLKSELGPEFADFDFDSLNPRAFVRKHLLDDDEDLNGVPTHRSPTDRDPTPAPGQPSRQAPPSHDAEAAPFDPDTT
jgi:sec-independent protein translocase protein TatB